MQDADTIDTDSTSNTISYSRLTNGLRSAFSILVWIAIFVAVGRLTSGGLAAARIPTRLRLNPQASATVLIEIIRPAVFFPLGLMTLISATAILQNLRWGRTLLVIGESIALTLWGYQFGKVLIESAMSGSMGIIVFEHLSPSFGDAVFPLTVIAFAVYERRPAL